MHVLVVGSGGREHALAWRLAGSASVGRVTTAPGNPGTADIGPNEAVDPLDGAAVADLAARIRADLVVVGAEAPLVAGVADTVRSRDIACFGPSAGAARIEASKSFAKAVMLAAGVPTGRYGAYSALAAAKDALDGYAPPYVVKADGLAAGKGVRVCADLAAAHDAIDDALGRGVFGDAGATVVIEEFLEGPEVSVFGMCDGRDVVLLPASQDFKRADDGDAGLNTGGMGAYSPVEWFDASGLADVVFRPVLAQMAAQGNPFVGCLYAGLVVTSDGPRLLEFNCRFGDPETQVVLPRVTSDLGDLLSAAATGSLAGVDVEVDAGACVNVVLASGGYPGEFATGMPITGVDAAAGDGVLVFHAGTRRADDGALVTAGGRVLSIVGRGRDIGEARDRAYSAADHINFDGIHRRSDIASEASTRQGART